MGVIRKVLCFLLGHRELHVGGWRVSQWGITEIAHVECSRCGKKLKEGW